MAAIYPNLFHAYPTRSGRSWLREVSKEDRQAFAMIGCQAHQYGKLGGKARAATAKRDHRGRFTKGTK